MSGGPAIIARAGQDTATGPVGGRTSAASGAGTMKAGIETSLRRREHVEDVPGEDADGHSLSISHNSFV